MKTRYFVFRKSDGSPYSLFKADFDGKFIKGEWHWNVPAKKWEPCSDVSNWYFMGDSDMDEVSEKEAQTFLA